MIVHTYTHTLWLTLTHTQDGSHLHTYRMVDTNTYMMVHTYTHTGWLTLTHIQDG